MPAPVTFVRATLTDSDTLNAAAFNALTAPSASVPDAAPGTAGVMPATTTLAGLALINAVDAAAQRIALGLGSLALQAANAVAIIGGAINGTPIGAVTPSTVAATTLSASGNTQIGGTNVGAGGLQIAVDRNLGFAENATESIANSFRQTNTAAYVIGSGVRWSANANAFASSYGSAAWARSAVVVNFGEVATYVNASASVAVGTDVAMTKVTSVTTTGFAVTGALNATGNLTLSAANSNILGGTSTGSSSIYNSTGAAGFTIYGPTHATKANHIDVFAGLLGHTFNSAGFALSGALTATGNGTFGGGGVSGTLLASNAGVDTTAYNAGSYNANHRLWLGTGNVTNAFAAIRFSGSGGVHEGLFGTVQNASGHAEFFWQLYNGTSYAERLRLSSTAFAVTGQFGNSFTGANGQYALSSDNTSSANFHVFYNSASVAIGSINRVTTTNAVSYNTTSDRRIKENFGLLTDSGRLIDLLTPRTFDRKDGSDTDRKGWLGFVAQEVHAADPVFARIGFVTVGDDDPKEVTKTWGVSSSPIDAILVAELKSLRARVAQLEAA